MFWDAIRGLMVFESSNNNRKSDAELQISGA